MTDTPTHTPHYDIGRACAASSGKNTRDFIAGPGRHRYIDIAEQLAVVHRTQRNRSLSRRLRPNLRHDRRRPATTDRWTALTNEQSFIRASADRLLFSSALERRGFTNVDEINRDNFFYEITTTNKAALRVWRSNK